MDKYSYFYGSQPVEFTRAKIPEIIYTDGIKADIEDSGNSLIVNESLNSLSTTPSNTRVVILNVQD